MGVAGKTAGIAGALNVNQQLGIFGGLFVHEKHQKHEKAFYYRSNAPRWNASEDAPASSLQSILLLMH
jgi:hypothetical protein